MGDISRPIFLNFPKFYYVVETSYEFDKKGYYFDNKIHGLTNIKKINL